MPPRAHVNGYEPFVFADFSGGLNLRDKSDTVGDKEAIDLLNVTFTERGAIRQRDGYADLTTSDLTNRVDSLGAYYTAAGQRHLIAGAGTRLEAVDTAGAVLGSLTGLTGGPYSFARHASPGNEYIYAANGADTLRRWNGSAWATPTATVNGVVAQPMPKPGAIAVTATVGGSTSGTNAANRLVATAFGTQTAAGPDGTDTNPSRVYFSNPGLPETWETDGSSGRGRNFRDLTPGDGEQIMAAVTWRELVFIFKETKFFVLWGESTASDGTPIFNFREIVSNVGLAAKHAVAVGRDGVYFMARNGIYRTTGDDPTLLSDKIGPLWTGDLDVFYQGDAINHPQIALTRMVWHDEQLFVAVPTGTSTYNNRLLVYDTQHQWWSIWDIPASALAVFRRSDRDEIAFGYATGLNRIGRHHTNLVDDRGTTITSRWRSGWSDYNLPVQKTIRETKAWGSGAVTVGFSTDYNVGITSSANALFSFSGTWPTSGTWGAWVASLDDVWPGEGTVTNKLLRRAIRGTTFSTQFANHPTSPIWAMHRVARNLRETRTPSVR
jgi:hypothetical protein